MTSTLSQSDISAYAGFFAWMGLPQQQRLNAITDRALTYDDLCAIDSEIYARKRVKEIEVADIDPAIKRYMLRTVRERGSQKPELVDYTKFLKSALERTSSQWGKKLAPYAPKPGAAGIKLQPARAVRVSSTQESYSDDSAVAIPYTTKGVEFNPAVMNIFIANVSELVRRADSHTGMAGSGCNYSASLHPGFVLIHCRASIAD